MTYSELCDLIQPPTGLWWDARSQKWINKWSKRPDDVVINGVNVHHHATTGVGGYNRLVTSSDGASANIIIMDDGTIIGSVSELYRAWTTGSYQADDDKITIEIQNSTGAPTWEISDDALASLIAVYADIAHRYGFPPDKAHLHGHRDYEATACPGPYLYPLLPYVARMASQLGDPDMATTSLLRRVITSIGGTDEYPSIRRSLRDISVTLRTHTVILRRIERTVKATNNTLETISNPGEGDNA